MGLFVQRYYDSSIGRFLSVDPIAANANTGHSFNRYAYVLNNPYKFTDPDGRCEKVTGSRICGGGAFGAMLATSARSSLDTGANRQSSRSTGRYSSLPYSGSPNKGLDPVVPEAIVLPALRLVKTLSTAGSVTEAAGGVSNPVPSTLARVIPDGIPANSLGAPGARDVFVTAADDIAGMTASQIANRLTIPNSSTGFRIIEFATPQSGIASPVFRMNPGFVGGGRTAGGAREFVVPNAPIPAGATVRVVGP